MTAVRDFQWIDYQKQFLFANTMEFFWLLAVSMSSFCLIFSAMHSLHSVELKFK